MFRCGQERQKKLIGSGSIGKMITVLDRDRRYADVSHTLTTITII